MLYIFAVLMMVGSFSPWAAHGPGMALLSALIFAIAIATEKIVKAIKDKS